MTTFGMALHLYQFRRLKVLYNGDLYLLSLVYYSTFQTFRFLSSFGNFWKSHASFVTFIPEYFDLFDAIVINNVSASDLILNNFSYKQN
jgi:hypothetical protein